MQRRKGRNKEDIEEKERIEQEVKRLQLLYRIEKGEVKQDYASLYKVYSSLYKLFVG